MRELLLYISAGIFLTGILLLSTFAIFVPQITIIMYVLSCYFMVSGVAMAYGIHRRGLEGFKSTARDLEEVQRLMGGFASELRKLDEALRTLAAYVARMRTQTANRVVPESRTLH